MSGPVVLHVEPRSSRGKEKAGQMRRSGKVPAVIYGAHQETESVSIDRREFDHVRAHTVGEQILIDVTHADGRIDKAFIREIQREPASQVVLHADLFRVSLTEKITLGVPVIPVGLAKGVKDQDGVLERIRRTILVRCLPTVVPPHIEVDVRDLALAHSIHVSDLKPIEGVEFLEPEAALFAVVGKAKEEVVVAAEATSPELIGKAAAEGEEGEAKAGEAKPAAGKGDAKAEAGKPEAKKPEGKK